MSSFAASLHPNTTPTCLRPRSPCEESTEPLPELVTQRIQHLQQIYSSVQPDHAYRETIPAIIEAYQRGSLTIESGQLSFWARNYQLGPAQKLETMSPRTEEERVRQQEIVMAMLDDALKVQNHGALLWIENPMPPE